MIIKRCCIGFLLSMGMTFLIAGLYELWFPFAAILGLTIYVMSLSLMHDRGKIREAEQKFYEITTYLEQILCSYKRFGQLKQALEDCSSLFDSAGSMGQELKQALHILTTGENVTGGSIAYEALSRIGKNERSRRMEIIHDFLCEVEQTGGHREQAIKILLEDLQMWRQRTVLYQKKKGYFRTETTIAAFLAALMCYISRFLTPKELGFHLSDTILYQCSTCFVFISFCISLIFVWRKMTGSWLDCYEGDYEREMGWKKKQYEILKNERKGNLLQKHLAKRICKREVKQEYPYWLLKMSLRVQTESVYNAAKQSIQKKFGMIAFEVQRMVENIYDNPTALKPYTDFFKELHLIEVQTGMKILYSITQNGFHESERQIDFLISQNNQLLDRAEKEKYENQTAGLGLLKHLPMLLACVKLLADLVNLLILTMGSFQNIA